MTIRNRQAQARESGHDRFSGEEHISSWPSELTEVLAKSLTRSVGNRHRKFQPHSETVRSSIDSVDKMRNLTSTFSDFWSYDAASAAGSSCQITKTTVNPEDNALYVLSEKRDDSGMVELEVLKAELNGNTHSLQVSYQSTTDQLAKSKIKLNVRISVHLFARGPLEYLFPDT